MNFSTASRYAAAAIGLGFGIRQIVKSVQRGRAEAKKGKSGAWGATKEFVGHQLAYTGSFLGGSALAGTGFGLVAARRALSRAKR